MLQISAVEFRRRLAGLEDVSQTVETDEGMRDLAIDFVLALKDVFGDSLDRKTVWNRISNGISIAANKCGGKVDSFIAEALEFVKASPEGVVTNDKLKRVNAEIKGQPKDWQMAFIKSCLTYRTLILLEAREISNDKFLWKEFNDRRNGR
ncbi:MAG: hypothetical protein FWG40_00570 [Peptococcaceae bacterium]|nr:hypothetical protein [Peptococcaceae bacterium]